jgi:two-component system sensor histidine kinase PilS (NtrC family)
MDNLRRSIAWAIVSRAGILAVVVALTLSIGPNSQYVWPVTLLAFVVFALTLVYAVALWIRVPAKVLIPVQAVNDILLVNWLVYRTGDVESPFNALYLVIVFAASVVAPRRAIFVTVVTVLSAVCLGVGAVSGALPRADGTSYEPSVLAELQLNIAYTTVAIVSVAILSTYLADRQRRADTALKAAAQDLAVLRAFNERIIDSMRSGLITAGLDGAITSCNRAAEEITGYAEDELVGRPLPELFGDVARAYLVPPDAQPASLLRSDVSFERPNGTVAHLGFNVAPLVAERGEVGGVVLIFQDLTEIFDLEQEVRRREKLAALGSMAAGLAHEIRNPLASIRGSVQVLARELPVDEDSRRLVDIILRESERLNRTLTDFLTYARPAAFAPAEFDLKRAIADAVTLLKNSPEVGPEHAVVESYPERPCTFVGDPNQVRQIFWNLARNGIQAMPSGGRLTVRVTPVDGTGYRVTVEDEGVGMNADEIGRLFEPFASQKPGGTGLGLAIVYQFVEEHGGRVSVESEPGSGTRVSVYLPNRQTAPDAPRTEGQPRGEPRRIS